MDFKAVRALVADDLRATDQLILDSLASDVALINQIGHYMIGSGGKRLRPMLVLLTARAFGYTGTQHIDSAAIIEFIHTATLLHDDVVDGSEQRRSQETANQVWGNAASVLVGDFIYSHTFRMMVALDSMQVMDILSTATNRIAEGEVMQLMNSHNPDLDEAGYLEIIARKTATLFAAGARLGAVVSQADASQEQACADYGYHLGIAFQIVDDMLDYGASSQQIGKNLGDDLAEGKITLPVLRAVQMSNAATQSQLHQIIQAGCVDRLNEVVKAIQATDAFDYCRQLAQQHADLAQQAIRSLPDTIYRTALLSLADFAVARQS
ncbi:MAG: polyprenyl synthetase family protein [Pseudomonadota bacterium]